MRLIRAFFSIFVVGALLAMTYPAAFIAMHGWEPSAWPVEMRSPLIWLSDLKTGNFTSLVLAYFQMVMGSCVAFADGGRFSFTSMACCIGTLGYTGSRADR